MGVSFAEANKHDQAGVNELMQVCHAFIVHAQDRPYWENRTEYIMIYGTMIYPANVAKHIVKKIKCSARGATQCCENGG